MIQTTKVSEDPLKDIQKKKLLPLFATKCGINHFSPSQFAKPDASWLIEYVHFDQPTRRRILKPNAATVPKITDPRVAKIAIIKLFFAASPHGFFVP